MDRETPELHRASVPVAAPRPLEREASVHLQPLRRRVVVACPEPQLSELIERVLQSRAEDLAQDGLEVRRVADGLTCLQAIELDRPDLIILHARLDRMSPTEILEAWDRSHPGDRLPAIVLSAAFGSDVPRGLAGAAVVQLPFDNGHLVDVVARALSSEDVR
jgi:CheY-like chemotaxis protein